MEYEPPKKGSNQGKKSKCQDEKEEVTLKTSQSERMPLNGMK